MNFGPLKKGSAINGFFIAPYFRYRIYSYQNYPDEETINTPTAPGEKYDAKAFGTGCSIGNQWIGKYLSLDIWAGRGVDYTSEIGTSWTVVAQQWYTINDQNINTKKFISVIRLGATIGFAF